MQSGHCCISCGTCWCVVISLEVFTVAVVKMNNLYTCFSLFHFGVSYFGVFLSQTDRREALSFDLLRSTKVLWLHRRRSPSKRTVSGNESLLSRKQQFWESGYFVQYHLFTLHFLGDVLYAQLLCLLSQEHCGTWCSHLCLQGTAAAGVIGYIFPYVWDSSCVTEKMLLPSHPIPSTGNNWYISSDNPQYCMSEAHCSSAVENIQHLCSFEATQRAAWYHLLGCYWWVFGVLEEGWRKHWQTNLARGPFRSRAMSIFSERRLKLLWLCTGSVSPLRVRPQRSSQKTAWIRPPPDAEPYCARTL